MIESREERAVWHSIQGEKRSKVGLVLCLLVLACALAGCASKEGGKQKGLFFWLHNLQPQEKTEAELAQEAMGHFQNGKYILAEENFQKIRDRFPFSAYATLAELRLADCKYYRGYYEEAIPLYEEFEKLHPTNEAVPYVIFQVSSCYFRLMESPDRDQTFTQKLIEVSDRLIKRFPQSPYTHEAEKRIAKAQERLAQSEMVVARWYYRTGQKAQAKRRCETVLKRYPGTLARATAEQLIERLDGAQVVRAAEPAPPSWWRRLIPFI